MGMVRIIVTLALAISLIGCNAQDIEVDFKQLNNVYEYGQSFEVLLNYMDSGDMPEEGLNTDLLSDSVIEYAESLIVTDTGINEGISYAEEDSLDPNEPIHPLYDLYGNVIGYGTLEESELSRKLYEDMPVYTVLLSEQHGDKLYFKVYNKLILESAIYITSLDKDYKIISFKVLN